MFKVEASSLKRLLIEGWNQKLPARLRIWVFTLVNLFGEF